MQKKGRSKRGKAAQKAAQKQGRKTRAEEPSAEGGAGLYLDTITEGYSVQQRLLRVWVRERALLRSDIERIEVLALANIQPHLRRALHVWAEKAGTEIYTLERLMSVVSDLLADLDFSLCEAKGTYDGASTVAPAPPKKSRSRKAPTKTAKSQ